jgi:hypothetical protein
MTNYSQVFADTLALYESNYVPGDQGDAGKGQVCVRAGYTIHTTLDASVGYIAKNPGQTQFYGVAVDALQDKSDGFGADYLTDELQPDGRRLIKLAYTPYPTPAVPPTTGWVAPTAAMLEHPGPLTLKATTPAPTPEPPAPSKDDEILSALDDMRAQAAADKAELLARDDANTQKSMQQISDLIEDVEASLKKAGIALVIHRRRKGEGTP